jgi:cobalt-zinc-cadmium efflux system outer membrane protein
LRKAWEIVALERSRRFPDMAVQVALNTERSYRDPALFLGFQIPLPVYEHNQGNICKAEHERNQILFRQFDLANQLNNRLELSHQEWCTAYEQTIALQELVATAAAESYQLAHESYQAGKVEYLALLDARSAWHSLQMQYLDALEECHRKRADTLKLTAKCCPNLLFP